MIKETLIDIKNVSFSYNGQLVLDDISLAVYKGGFLGVIGPNGSGKTTLLKIILGLLKPQKGTVSLFGQDLPVFHEWSKIGYVPQKAGSSFAGFPITVEEIVAMGRLNNKHFFDFEDKEDKKAVTESLIAVEMEKYRKRLINELSGGEQQRVFIAKAVASRPALLILDEPTVGVDAESQSKFYQLLSDLNKRFNLTLVLVSHDIDVVAHEVSEVACINRRLICHGQPKEILKGDFMEKLYGKNLRFVVHGH